MSRPSHGFGMLCLIAGLGISSAGCSSVPNSAVLTPVVPASGAAPSAHERVQIKEFSDLPRYGLYYHPNAITAGPDQLLWVVDNIDQDSGVDAVVGVKTSGKAQHTYYPSGTSSATAFQDIAAGSDGALWMPDDLNLQIVRMTTAGVFTEYALNNGTDPIAITSGPDRALWFTADVFSGGGAIERITTNGQITEHSISAEPGDIAAGSDGALWFTEPFANAIGRITTHGNVTEFTKGMGQGPSSIALGPDGAMWFTEYVNGSDAIGRISKSGHVTEYSHGITSGVAVNDIAAGPDGAMWFTQFGSYYATPEIGRISMSAVVTEYSRGLPAQAGPAGIVEGPDGAMWFTDFMNDRTGRVSL